MLLADVLGVDGDWTLLGSDISQGVLARAQKAHYALAALRGHAGQPICDAFASKASASIPGPFW